jgi:hypothetical protein
MLSSYRRCAWRMIATTVLFFFALLASPSAAVQAVQEGDSLTLANESVSATWSVRNGALGWQSLMNRFTRASLPLHGSPFELVPREGPVLRSSDLKIVAGPLIEEVATSTNSPRAADHLPGRQIRVELEDASAKLRVTWKAILHDDANYVRQEITVHAEQQPFPLTQVNLVDAIVPGAAVSGQAKGSPVTAGTWFLGFEHPLSECRVHEDRVSCWLSRELPLQAGQSVTFFLRPWCYASRAVAP